MATYTLKNRPVRIKTPFGEDVLLLKSFSGMERLGRPFQYELVLASEEHELDYKQIIGQNVMIFVDKKDKEPRYFNGFVSRFAQTKYEQKLAEYHATVVPWLWFLTRSSDCRVFQNTTIPEVIKHVFKDFGFSDIIDRLQGSYRQWSYCVQYRETAFDFISRLMEEEGIYYFFKHEDGKHSIVLCDSPMSHKKFGGYEELLYRPSAANVMETLKTWVVEHEVQTGTFLAKNFDFTNTRVNSLQNALKDRRHSQSQGEQFDYLGEQSPFDEYHTADGSSAPNENERYSKLRLEELQAQHETYSGEGDVRGICTGVRFVLKGHPRKSFEKEYLTTGAEYLIQCNPFETTEDAGDEFKYNARMTAMLLDDQYRSPRMTPKPIVHGPQTAIVVGPSGQKIWTDPTGYGMVKVQFHWDRLGKNDENSSCWMRVSQAWAGKKWGDMALPHVGDEVIVEFLEGDPDRPIITGRVYNATKMPPLDLPANKDKRIWQDDFGNRMIFDATPGDEHIRLYSPHHKSGLTLGRSSVNYTLSDGVTATLGTTVGFTGGASTSVVGGLSLSATVGASVSAVVGTSFGANIGANISVNLGPQFGFTAGPAYQQHESDYSQVCKGHAIISAKNDLNLLAGAGGTKTSIIHADGSHFQVSVGQPMDITEGAPQWTQIVNGIAAGFPVLAAILAGVAGVFVQSNANPLDADTQQYSTDLGNNASQSTLNQDQNKINQDVDQGAPSGTATPTQEALLESAVALEAFSGALMIAACIANKMKETSATIQKHEHDKAHSVMDLDKEGNIKILADKSITIGKKKAGAASPDTTIKLDENGNVTINSTDSITLICKKLMLAGDDGIELSSKQLKGNGPVKLANGALEIQAPPPPPKGALPPPPTMPPSPSTKLPPPQTKLPPPPPKKTP